MNDMTPTIEAIQQVDAIADKAMGEGWSREALYGTQGRFKFPMGGDYGLVCFLSDGDTIGEVTAEYIEIVKRRGNKLKLYRRNR